MVWAAIDLGYRSPLVVIDGNLNVQRYRDDILAHHVIFLFHDNANISTDLNPIEHVWNSLDRRLRRCPNPPANVNKLRQALIQEWNNIPEAQINTLVNSMLRRCNTVVNSRGGHTRL